MHLHFTCNKEVFILKTVSLKIEKKTSIEVQSEGRAHSKLKKLIQKKMLYWKREISATPIQLHLKELYGECYPHTLAPNPEMKAVSYTGKTLGRCSIISFRKVVVACSV